MIRLIALDLDGTLLDPAGRITQASKDAIARARAAGVRVVLNTGRPIQEAVWFAGEAGCDALLSCLGGAAVVDGVRGEMCIRDRGNDGDLLHRGGVGLEGGYQGVALSLIHIFPQGQGEL